MAVATGRALQNLTKMAGYGLLTKDAVSPGAAPDPRIYGVFGPQYASMLANDPNEISRFGSEALLGAEARQERDDYKQSLREAALGEQMLAKIQGKASTSAALGNQLGTMAKYGILGHVNVADDGSLEVDPVAAALSNDTSMNERFAATRKDEGSTLESLYKSGVRVDPATAAGYMNVNPAQDKADTYGVFGANGYNPDDANAAEKNRIDEADNNNPNKYNHKTGGSGSGSAGDMQITVTPGMFGMPEQAVTRYKGQAARDYAARQGASAVPAASGLQARVAAAKAAGSKVEQVGNRIKITGRSGASRLYNADGSVAQ